MKNGNEARDVLSDSLKRHRTVGRDPDRTKNQSDFKIRYYTLLEIKYMLLISQKFLLSIFYISSYLHNDVTNCQRSLKWRSL